MGKKEKLARNISLLEGVYIQTEAEKYPQHPENPGALGTRDQTIFFQMLPSQSPPPTHKNKTSENHVI